MAFSIVAIGATFGVLATGKESENMINPTDNTPTIVVSPAGRPGLNQTTVRDNDKRNPFAVRAWSLALLSFAISLFFS